MNKEEFDNAKSARIGQKMEFTEDFTVGTLFHGEEVIKRGTTLYVGADGFFRIENGKMLRMDDDFEVDGFNPDGMADYIYKIVSREFPLDDMLDDYDVNKSAFKGEISFALGELGL